MIGVVLPDTINLWIDLTWTKGESDLNSWPDSAIFSVQGKPPELFKWPSRCILIINKRVIEQSNIQLSVSQDEFCRNIDNIIDEQYSFTFNKIQDSLHVSPTSLKAAINTNNRNNRFRRQSSFNTSESYALMKNTYPSRGHVFKPSGSIYHTCKFPRWLNKKWHNLKQTKMKN